MLILNLKQHVLRMGQGCPEKRICSQSKMQKLIFCCTKQKQHQQHSKTESEAHMAAIC